MVDLQQQNLLDAKLIMMKAIYPGTFDPLTNGHLDIITRAAKIFDHLIIGVTTNIFKTPLFKIEERVAIVSEVIQDLSNVSVCQFGGLLVDFAQECNAQVIVRGLREPNDFLSEYQMALMNKLQCAKIESVFLVSSSSYHFVSSSLIKEVAGLGGDISKLVPNCVQVLLSEKFAKQK